jgi:hypothetical protein
MAVVACRGGGEAGDGLADSPQMPATATGPTSAGCRALAGVAPRVLLAGWMSVFDKTPPDWSSKIAA